MTLVFDPTINYGTIIAVVSILGTLIGFYWKTRELIFKLHAENLQAQAKMQASLDAMEVRVSTMWRFFENDMERRRDR